MVKKSILSLIVIILVFAGIFYFFTQKYSYNLSQTVKEAVDNRNPSLCNELPHGDIVYQPDVECYGRVAVALKDETICDQAPASPDPGVRDLCYVDVNKVKADPAICEKIRQTNRDQYTQSALAQCYLDLAPVLKDYSICDQIHPVFTDFKDYCYRDTAIVLEDLARCPLFNNELNKDRCFSLIGIKKNDISICLEANNKGEKNICISKIAANENDLGVCDKYMSIAPTNSYNVSDKDQCYYEVGVKNLNLDICSKIIATYEKGTCYEQIAIQKTDPNICVQAQDSSFCYEQIASKTKDASVCDYINDPQYPKKRCLSIVQEAKNKVPGIWDK